MEYFQIIWNIIIVYGLIIGCWLLIGFVVFGIINLFFEDSPYPTEDDLTAMDLYRLWLSVFYFITFQWGSL